MPRSRLGNRKLLQALDLIGLVYAAAEDRQVWTTLLTGVAGVFSAPAAGLISHDLAASGAAVLFTGLDPEAARLYNEHYHRLDPWACSPVSPALSRTGRAVLGDEMASRQQLKKGEYYPFARRFGITRLLHGPLRTEQGHSGLSIVRSEHHAEFTRQDADFLNVLLPHLRRSLRLHDLLARARQQQEALADALDRMSCAVLLVTEGAGVVHANRAAAALLARRDGLVLERQGLAAASPAHTSALRALCARCARTTRRESLEPGGALALSRPSGRRRLQLVVSPVRRRDPFGLRDERVAAVVLVSDPEHDVPPDRELLQLYYGLSPAEADVAARMAQGATLDEIAAARRYTKETARWYAKQVLAKTGCRTRAALVRQISMTLSSLSRRV